VSFRTLVRGRKLLSAALVLAAVGVFAPGTVTAIQTPIEHVVIIYMENHSFDNVLAPLCVWDERCDAVLNGETHDGRLVPLRRADDIVPGSSHGVETQQGVINNGKMNGWDIAINACTEENGYVCYQAFHPDQIPSLSALARGFVISDRTFQMDPIPTFGAHLELVAAQTAGFKGEHPGHVAVGAPAGGKGWGCDSLREAEWAPSPTDPYLYEPSCIPDQNGSGPYRPSPVQHVPTIMDRMDGAGLSWKIYAPQEGDDGYIYATCPSFAECLYGEQRAHYRPYQEFAIDAQNGDLPNLSILIPDLLVSQHNHVSMLAGDNWIAEQMNAVMNGPDWGSSATFITYDDCGCFYDHVRPPVGLGIRVPMVIVSPYARAGYTDSRVASFASMLAYTEHNFGLEPLWVTDANAYDYARAFDYGQDPLPPIRLQQHPVPDWVDAYVRAHPPDQDDPT
jgi:phospholipase C